MLCIINIKINKNNLVLICRRLSMKKIYFALIMIAFALIGCKAHVEVETKLSNLINQPVHTEHAIISIEIPTCNSYEDSRLPSRALTDVQQKIPTIFHGAKYKECYSKGFETYATFEVPIGIGIAKQNSQVDNDINLVVNDEFILMTYATDSLNQRIQHFNKSEYIDSLKIEINIVNDLGVDVEATCLSSYINNSPCTWGKIFLQKNQKINIVLSNVSTDKFLGKNRTSEYAEVMAFNAKPKKN